MFILPSMQLKTYKNIRRLQQIITILIKYGFGGLVRELRLLPYFAAFERLLFFKRSRSGEEVSLPKRIRLVLEELGPIFVKLGQMASTRADVFPPDWIEEIKKLQDMVSPVPFEETRRVVEGALNAPIDTVFSTFEENPVASASIAQVHYATLMDGSDVAVKVRRPGIDKVIEADISVMHTFADLLERYVPRARRYRPKEVVDEFSRVIQKEQDLTIEGGNAERFNKMFEGVATVHIPKVYWDYTTPEMLTLERISGIPIDEAGRIREQGLDVKKIAEEGIRAFFRQVFEYGLFHADLHPGNMFVRPDGVIVYLDFGIVGRLDGRLRSYLASMLFHLVKEDYYRMAVVHREMGLISKDVDIHEFEEALREIVEPMYGRTLQRINVSALIMELINTARRFQMKLQPNLLLLQKSMVIIEGVGRQLHPDINMWAVAKPLIYKWMIKEKASPNRLYKRGRESLDGLAGVARDIPYQAHTIMNKVIEGEMEIGFVHHRLDSMERQIDNLGYRISLGLIIASLVLGASLAVVFSSVEAYRVFDIPLLGLLGFVFAVVLAVRLAWSFRSGGLKDRERLG